MTLEELLKYMPENHKRFKGKTYHGFIYHFVDQLQISEAAEKAGMNKTGLRVEVDKLRKVMKRDGWYKVKIVRDVYVKGDPLAGRIF